MAKSNIQSLTIHKLEYPVYDMNGQLILPSGSELTSETLDYVTSLNKSVPSQRFPLLQFLQKDILDMIKLPPYNVIFSDQEQLAEILKILEKVSIVFPVLQSMNHFKKMEPYTYSHILRTFALTTLLAREMISDYEDMIREIGSSPAHDIGKMSVPVHILTKPDALTSAELRMMRHHTLAGYVLLCYYLRDSENLSAIIARDHHERKDGTGYPLGKSLIDRMVEIVAVSDVYDALISKRSYRASAFDNRTAIEEITAMAEQGQISWDIVKVLVAFNRKNRPHFSDCIISTVKRGTPPQGNVYGITLQ